mgnify:FL=1
MSKHAPRGPMKASDHLQGAHPLQGRQIGGDAPRCSAKSKRSQKACQNPAIAGGTVCRMHGGSAPQVRAAAEFRVMDAYRALQPKAVAVVDALLGRDEYPTVQIAAVREVMDRSEGKARESVSVTGSEGGPIVVKWQGE